MARRDEFDDEGFLDSLLNRKGNAELPRGLRRIFIVLGVLVVFAVLIAVVASSWPAGKGVEEGAVPIVRADGGPFKIPPEEPGGMNVPNKDSTIFETLKGETKESDTENLLEDAADTASILPSKEESISGLSMPPQPDPVIENKIAEKSKSVSIIDELKTEPRPDNTEPVKVDKKPEAPKPPVISSSGSTYIQLAAVKSEAEASILWAKAKSKYSELSSLSMRTQKVDLEEKGILYRVQAGPVSKDSAAALCNAIKSRGGSCIIAK